MASTRHLPRRTRGALAAALAIALCGCGGLESPDLAVGTVEGRLVGARAGAYVYPLGRPDLKARVVGERWTIDGVPAGARSLVVVDRGDPEAVGTCTTRVLCVDVRGADRTRTSDVAASELVPAGELLAVAQPASGALPAEARFAVVGTDVEVVTATGAAVLWPLPPTDGTDPLAPAAWTVSVEMAGYLPAFVETSIASAATTPVAVPLEPDRSSPKPGCRSSGCRDGLVCSADGACYGCVDDSDCPGDPGACDLALHVCRGSAGEGAVCASCTSSADCASGSCAVASGAASGYCTRACDSAAPCPAGLQCRKEEDGSRTCAPGTTCAEYLASFGESCAKAEHCSPALVDPSCAEAAGRRAGYCTAACSTDADCLVAGWVCAAAAGQQALCVRAQ